MYATLKRIFMKKIILAFDGSNFSQGAFEFARRLNAMQPILLTGIFLPQAELSYMWSYANTPGAQFIPLIEESESALIQKNITLFETLCQSNDIEYKIHRDFFDMVLPALRKESRHADLLILGTESFYENIETDEPNRFLEDALQDVACPVLLVPEKFEFPESIILAYDGSEASVYAIKQFAYLFPELTNKKTLLVYANDNPEDNIPEKSLIEELVTRHFSDITFFKLDLDPGTYFSTWVKGRGATLVVSGSYGRSNFSQLFKKSFVRELIAEHRLPVFVAHK
jgi:nucleotide-binding universal stress UspA family protein